MVMAKMGRPKTEEYTKKSIRFSAVEKAMKDIIASKSGDEKAVAQEVLEELKMRVC